MERTGGGEATLPIMREAARQPPSALDGIFPGSWIDANLYICIGHRDDPGSAPHVIRVVRQENFRENDGPDREDRRSRGATRQQVRDAGAKPKAGRPKHFMFAFKPPTKQFNLKLSFARSRVSRDEVIEALEQILRELRKAK